MKSSVWRYGLADGYSYTLEEVGKIFSVTRERVRQIENKAVRTLQHPTRAKKLASFVERPIAIPLAFADEDLRTMGKRVGPCLQRTQFRKTDLCAEREDAVDAAGEDHV